MPKQTHNEQLHSEDLLTKYEETERGKGVIAAPTEYDDIMKTVPPGMLITTDELRQALAKKHGVDYACSQTTGICVTMVANASKEREKQGKADLTPYWRTLKKDGELNEKYPGGIEGHKKLLEAEGHLVLKKGKRHVVRYYREKLFNLEEEEQPTLL